MRGSLDQSEAERRAVPFRPGDQAESEGKRPSGHPLAERDSPFKGGFSYDK